MPQATFHFPRGFLWGTATAAHQVEGNNTNNNWYAWEQAGRTVHPSGLACDWWGGRWREDLDRAAEGGQNAHRFSVEWSRIQPEPDRWDEEALDHYRQMLQGMYERGITPLVTLHHFTDPLWLSEQGGWENEAAIGHFV
ncbi:MAG: glycoside hydrolase family 1 protein, partial [Anaerolineae bacterium]